MLWILLANGFLGVLPYLAMENRNDDTPAYHREKGEKTFEGGEPRKTPLLEENVEKAVAFGNYFHNQWALT